MFAFEHGMNTVTAISVFPAILYYHVRDVGTDRRHTASNLVYVRAGLNRNTLVETIVVISSSSLSVQACERNIQNECNTA